MAPIRSSRRLKQKATDAQDEADAASTTIVTRTTAAKPAADTEPSARTSTKKTATIRTRSSTRKTPTIRMAAVASPPKKARTVKTTTPKASSKGKARATTSTMKASQENTSGGGDVDKKVARGKVAPAGDDGAPNATPKAKGRNKGKGKVKKDKDAITATTAPKDRKESKSNMTRAKKIKDKTAVVTEEKEPKTKTKRTKKLKDETGTTATGATAGAGTETVAKAARKGKGKMFKTEGGDSPVTPASAGRKKRRVDTNDNDTNDDGGDGSGAASSTQSGPALKKQRTTTSKKRGAAEAHVEPSKPIIINKSDPFSVLPTELWHEVMSYLPLSQISKASTVSKGWLEGTRSLPVWREVCTRAALGKPKKKYLTHMSLVCAQSFWICEHCLTMNNGRGSDIPMPVEIHGLANERQMLCRDCRCQYYKKHPEETKVRKNVVNSYGEYIYQRDVRITKTQACDSFHLREEDLESLDCREKRNPHYRNAAPMRLYLENQVQERALKVHGGWIGIRAVRRGVAKIRREAAKTRAQGLQTRVVLNPDKNTNKDMSGKDKKSVTEAEAKASNEKSVQSWLKVLRQPYQRTQLVEAIAEAEGRVATGQPPLAIKTTTPDRKWIDSVRNLFNRIPEQREAIKKIVQAFDAGAYDTQEAASSSATGAATAGAGAATSGVGAGPSALSTVHLP
ncbi:hypothetical protein BGZ96_003755 [Linnemannia gamsii]|uniref:F-box domain-containing protein n=1 Tax=Linnemannia gamsii TaxID=64522 RepID=A0ABQ7K6I3_9FUNG|nr:hypothetical protein BGZ96_003755 [Linnemannia gamsii]